MHSQPSFEDFAAATRADGFPDVLEREWAPNAATAVHTHPFSVKALVVRGEMWLSVGERTQHLRAGDRFELPARIEHSERYGPEGAAYWVGRRSEDGEA